MKNSLVFFLLVVGFVVKAQSKDEKAVIARTYLLSHTIFGTKDSLTLEDLFAHPATYGHSHGNLQTREEAIKGATSNKSTYTDTSITNITVYFNGETAITRYLFKANENKVNGTITPLNFAMIMVWTKEKGKWRLFGRQAANIN